jgi:AraC-like DNA-binding protein
LFAKRQVIKRLSTGKLRHLSIQLIRDNFAMPQISTSVLTAILHGAKKFGVEPNELILPLGIEKAWLNDPLKRVNCELAFELMSKAQQQAKDPLFGFHLGQGMQPTTIGVMGYLISSATTLREGIASFCRYQQVFGEGMILKMTPDTAPLNAAKETSTVFTISIHPDITNPPSFHTIESNITGFIAMMRGLLGQTIRPLRVSFSHSCAGDPLEYQSFFDTRNVLFEQKENAIILENECLDLTLLQANKALFSWSEQQASQILRLTSRSGYSNKVSNAILKKLNGELPNLENVAKSLHLSARALQRHLKAENSGFTELLDKVRRDAALFHLDNKQMTIDEISYLLGYSDASAFRKAFKKWTGKAPSDYRS